MAFVECLEPKPQAANVTVWTIERKARLHQLIEEKRSGMECAVAISAEFGIRLSRNAIMGAAHRFGFQLKSQSHNTRIARREPKKITPKPAKEGWRGTNIRRQAAKLELIVPAVSDLDIPQEQRKTFMELGPHHCRWGVGNVGEPDFFFCGGTTEDDRSYCAHHHRLSIRSR